MNRLQNITDTVLIGETIMHWHNGECLLSVVIGKGFAKGQHALVVEINNKEIFVTEIV